MNKRPFVAPAALVTTSLVILFALFLFFLLPAGADSAGAAGGVCTQFSLNQGRNAETGAGIDGRYEMRVVTTGGLLAAWPANGRATHSGWLTDLPTVADGGSWVMVDFYPDNGETAVGLEILNPAPNTAYGWVANGQCHTIELQFPQSWRVDNQTSVSEESGVGGGGMEIVDEPENESVTESEGAFEEFAGSQTAALTDLRPIPITRFSDVPTIVQAENFGAWQLGNSVGYGFTLTNPSSDHFITNIEYKVFVNNAETGVEFQLRELYPAESVNVGFVLGSGGEEVESVEIVFTSAAQVAIDETAVSLTLIDSFGAFRESYVAVAESCDTPDDSVECDENRLDFNLFIFNPNGGFTASSTHYDISVFDGDGNVIGRAADALGDISPRQVHHLSGSIFLPDPSLVNNVEVTIEPEQFTPTTPEAPASLFQTSFNGQNASVVLANSSDANFSLYEIVEHFGFTVVVIAFDEEGVTIGGNYQTVRMGDEIGFNRALSLPIATTTSPADVQVYVSADAIDEKPPRGGGGNHPGRENFPITYSGITVNE